MPTFYVWEEGVGWVTSSAAGLGSPLTTKGDLYGFSSTNARVPIGTDGQVLTADSTQPLGVKWDTGASAGVSSLDSITGAVSLVAGSNVTITDNSPSAGEITIAATGGGGGFTVVDYAQITSNVSITSHTAPGTSIVTGAGFTANGTSAYQITFATPAAVTPTGAAGMDILLVESGSAIGRMAGYLSPTTNALESPLLTAVRLVPTAGSHTYTIASTTASGTGTIGAGSGGSTTFFPAYIMVTKLA